MSLAGLGNRKALGAFLLDVCYGGMNHDADTDAAQVSCRDDVTFLVRDHKWHLCDND